MRLRLDYADQNESFALLLPRDGTVERVVSSSNKIEWTLFHLDYGFEYEGRPYSYLLLRSRWPGREIGDSEPPSVFVLLVDELARVQDGFEVDDFKHVAWGLVTPI